MRVRNLCNDIESKYVYDTTGRLSRLLVKIDCCDEITKYVYGRGLLGHETNGTFKTYHYDCRGSTVAITNGAGVIIDTFEYDTYGKLLNHTGNIDTPFLYNGRDGVMTDHNGLIYMRNRYYSPLLRRFVNADVLHGNIADSTSLNRYAYVNGNPVSLIDPLGLSADNRDGEGSLGLSPTIQLQLKKQSDEYFQGKTTFDALVDEQWLIAFYEYMYHGIVNEPRPNNIGKGTWAKQVDADLKWLDDVFGPNSAIGKAVKAYGDISVVIDVGVGVYENVQSGTDTQRIVTDAMVDAGVSVGSGWLAGLAGRGATAVVTKICVATGTAIAPGAGTLIGIGMGVVAGVGIYFVTEVVEINGKSIVDRVKEDVDDIVDFCGNTPNIVCAIIGAGGGGGGGAFNPPKTCFGLDWWLY